ncbi:MAG: HAMP domain-containing sensor histidine kinase [Actinomycetota bacterium]
MTDRWRIGWTAVAVGVALVIMAPLGYLGFRQEVAGIKAETEAWAVYKVETALLDRIADVDRDPPDNTWLVNTEGGWSEPAGETWTEPPLLSLADAALGGTATREYNFEGDWLAYAVWVGEDNVVVSVVDRGGEIEEIGAARLRWSALMLGAALVAGFVAYLVLGRMQRPVRQAHVVNRDFIADAAHELRTPLSIIQASAGFALARERDPVDYRESLTEILDASERAGASVGELLEFARLEAGQASLRLAPLRLDLLVEEVAASVRVENVTVQAAPGEAVVVEADYNLLRQVIDNITRNAAARADKVTLATKLDAREAIIEVVDDGPGFDPGVIDHVFERFRRGDQAGSVGLGMAIARTIVELHNGSCAAANRSADEGGGAVVTIRLPYKSSLV